jgi:hypothetical protein
MEHRHGQGASVQLEPGDRRIVAVRPYVEVGLAPDTCQRCGTELAGARAWEVVVRDGADPLELELIVCGTCAGVLRPVRVAVSLTAVDAAERADHAPLQQLVATIREARDEPPTEVLRLRASDVTRLADAYGLSRAAFVQRLHDDGLAEDLG